MTPNPAPPAPVARRYRGWLAVFAAGLVALDLVAGFALSRLHPTVGRGQLVGMANSAIRARADVLILGASTASHHYDDRALSRSLGLRVFNTGLDGRGIVFSRGLLALAAAEHRPRLVVVDVSYSDRDRTSARILAPFVGRNRVVDEVVGWSWRERLKLASRAYRFNGLVLPMLRNLGTPPMESGFEPLEGAIADSVPWRGPARGGEGFGSWYGIELRKLVAEARAAGARVVFVESPTWGGKVARVALDEYARVAREMDVPTHELAPDTHAEFRRASLYRDRAHLNREGAAIFTRAVEGILRDELARAAADSPAGPGGREAPGAAAAPVPAPASVPR